MNDHHRNEARIKGRKFSDMIWSAIGGAIAIALALLLVGGRNSPFLLFSLGGSTVFLFVLTETEAAQPRALLGGHIGGALIGILCYQICGTALWVSVAAVVLTMMFMVVTRTIHPPAGANPLIMVDHHAGFLSVLNPVAAGVLTLFVVAMVWSCFRPGKKYPVRWW